MSGIARIRAAFVSARAERRGALIPFVTGGYPDLDSTERLLRELPRVGADLIEIGVPFSDPIADGPVIAASMHEALQRGVNPDQIFACVERARSAAPVLAMVSYSIVGRMGVERFIAAGVDRGVSGFIVPDADPGVAEEISRTASARGAAFCALIAPTTPAARAARLAAISTGFVYLLARAGVTGERSEAPDVSDRVAVLRTLTDAPIAVGFGLSSAEHVHAIGAQADGAIVGSALVRRMAEAVARGESAADAAIAFARQLSGRPPQ
ncbi:MAG: Tryptophan synthase alpha chain [Planctomycetota bacterium]